MSSRDRRSPFRRLLPLAALTVAYAAVLLYVWQADIGIRQVRVTATLAVTLLAALLALLWFVLLSSFPRRQRWGVGAAALGLVLLAAGLFRIEGVTGDLRPILRFRWSGVPAAVESPAGPAEIQLAADGDAGWPGFLGPRHDATLPGPGLATDWDSRPPEEVWRREIGGGWGSFAVSGQLAVTQEQRGDQELVVAYDVATGEPLWSHADEARYESTIAGTGPRATPAIADGRVFTVGGTGLLNALDARTGRELWSVDLLEQQSAELPPWGKSNSPLVRGDRVIASAGGPGGRSLVAYEAASGEQVWAGGDSPSGYATPVEATIDGVEQIVIFNADSLASHAPEDGSLLWSHPWPRGQPNVAQPLMLPGGRVLASSGYGVGAKLIAVQRVEGSWSTEVVWETHRLKSKFAHMILHDGHVYGLDDGIMVCLDPDTGELLWKGGRYGHGQLLLVDDLLLVQAESGEVVLVDPDPAELRELTRFPALDGKTWNVPTLVGNLLLVRNHREAAAYRLPLR